jgi:hypothetical protein
MGDEALAPEVKETHHINVVGEINISQIFFAQYFTYLLRSTYLRRQKLSKTKTRKLKRLQLGVSCNYRDIHQHCQLQSRCAVTAAAKTAQNEN